MVDRNIDVRLLFPPFLSMVVAGLQDAHASGIDAYIFEGWRSAATQSDLYQQGRTKPGPVITDALPWQSWHQYGCAVDLVFGGPGKWTWAGDYDGLASIMKGKGLEWAGDWVHFKERPHFQLTGGMSVLRAIEINKVSGVLGVWSAILETAKQTTLPGNGQP